MLNTVYYDGPDATPLLIAHGLFGSARNWNVIAKRLSTTRPVVVVDMRNHGASAWLNGHSYADLAEDLAGVIDKPVDVLGHSMGGKASMVLALKYPSKVNRLVIADIAPVAYTHTQMGPIEAMRAVDLNAVNSRADALDQLGGLQDGVAEFLLQSLDVKGKRWKLNLDVLAAEMDKIIGFPHVSGTFDGPTLFLSGANSDYVQHAHRNTIKALFPQSYFAKISGAGHWLHAEKPREFEASIAAFCAV
ncbi:MAG: alpha/beta fold hydrolase [Yoonia sp.]|nr:alpha/beta fold hydrolase [Yoonia sp.]